jgi:hypothetical protein
MKWMIGIVSALGISVLSIGLALLFVGSGSSIADHDENISANNGLSSDIKVQGDWSIDVTNPDGTLAEHREFTNELRDGGNMLPRLLIGQKIAGTWLVDLSVTTNDSETPEESLSNASLTPNRLGEGETNPNDLSRWTGGLDVVYSGASIFLTGSITVGNAGHFNQVSASVSECSRQEGLRCNNYPKTWFSSKFLGDSVVVVKDQVINVSVTYTFGS